MLLKNIEHIDDISSWSKYFLKKYYKIYSAFRIHELSNYFKYRVFCYQTGKRGGVIVDI